MSLGLGESTLRNLPLEVVLRITDFLPTPDLGSFRLTCRAIHDFIDGLFTKEFFTRKQFMISLFSLNALVDISQSRLGPHLRFLHIGLEAIGSDRRNLTPSDDGLKPEALRRYGEIVKRENFARAGGLHRDLLVAALKNLPNLEAIIIRDFNSQRRTRDGWNTEWRSYGFATFSRLTGISPSYPRRSSLPHGIFNDASATCSLILLACAQAGARPRSLEIITQRIPVRSEAFSAPGIDDQLIPVIEGLEKLHLNFWPEARRDGGPDIATLDLTDGRITDPTNSKGIEDEDYPLYWFIARAKNLTDLRINHTHTLIQSPHNNSAHYLLKWLAAAATKGVLPRLQKLSLGRAIVDAEVLTSLIGAYAGQLQSLELWRMSLCRPLPQSMVPTGPWPKISFWPHALREIRNIPDLSSLKHVKIGLMGQTYTNHAGQAHPVCIVTATGKPEIEYTGSDWRRWIQDVEKHIEVSWTVQFDEFHHGGLEDESESEESATDSDAENE